MHSSSDSKVFFLTEGNPVFTFRGRTRLKQFIPELFKKEKVPLRQICYIFCKDKYLHAMNKEFLNHDELTDIITFDLSEKKAPKVADVFISIDRVKENARSNKVSFENELLRVIFHGALHLVGYSDKTPKRKKEMRDREDFYLQKYHSD